MNCPICGNKLTQYHDFGMVSQPMKECPNGCYGKEFSYGATRTMVMGQEFIYSYSMTEAESDAVLDAMQDAIDTARLNMFVKGDTH